MKNIPLSTLKIVYILKVMGITSFLLLTGCNTENEAAESNELTDPNLISGYIVDTSTGNPLKNASISTDPPTAEVITNSDGKYVLKNDLIELGKVYRVNIRKSGYAPETVTVTVKPSGNNIADARLSRDITGVVAEPLYLRFTERDDNLSFVLSSTILGNYYMIENDQPWITVSPRSGEISDTQQRLITVAVDRGQLDPGIHESRLIINSSFNSIVVDLIVAVDTEIASTSVENTDSGTGTETNHTDDLSVFFSNLTIDTDKCSLSNNAILQCELYITSPSESTQLTFNKSNTRVDIGGISYEPTIIGLGAKSTSAYTVTETLPQAFPTRLWAEFEGITVDDLQYQSVVDHWAVELRPHGTNKSEVVLLKNLPLH